MRVLCPPLLALALLLPLQAWGSMLQLTTDLENFRLESADKLSELYTLRGVYADSANTAATEGVQIFITEIRGAVFLVNNVLDIVFLYGLHKDYDDKGVVGEFVTSRLSEIQDNLRFNINKLSDLAAILQRQGQETLANDFQDYRIKLVEVSDTIRAMNETIAVEMLAPRE